MMYIHGTYYHDQYKKSAIKSTANGALNPTMMICLEIRFRETFIIMLILKRKTVHNLETPSNMNMFMIWQI